MHPQGRCPEGSKSYRLVGDRGRLVYRICADCLPRYEALGMTFVPIDTPEWVQRAAEKRLPVQNRYAA